MTEGGGGTTVGNHWYLVRAFYHAAVRERYPVCKAHLADSIALMLMMLK